MKILGDALKREREMRQLSLAEIANVIHINCKYLQALEDEDFDSIPGPFYIRYYLRNYLRGMGADETTFCNKYKEYIDPLLNKNQVKVEFYFDKLEYTKFKKRQLLVMAIGFVAVICAMLFVMFPPLQVIWNSMLTKMAPKPVHVSESALMPAPLASHFSFDFSPLTLVVRFSQPCWTRVLRGDEKIVERTYAANETMTVKGYSLSVLFGNPVGIDAQLNGKTIPSPADKTRPWQLQLRPDQLPPSGDNERKNSPGL